MPAYDYSIVADIYDTFCVFDGDLHFFRGLVAGVEGPVLELMAGTGRVSLPMIEAGADVTCVDRAWPMLARLARKLRIGALGARLVCADVCTLPLEPPFELIVLPFQGFTELVGEESQRRLFLEAARLLPVGGRFICTSHNPRERMATIDGRWRELGRFRDGSGREVALHLKASMSDRPGVAEGVQRIEIREPEGGLLESRRFGLQFSLVSSDTLAGLAAPAGLRLVDLLGDYGGGPYEEGSSPCLIAVLEKTV